MTMRYLIHKNSCGGFYCDVAGSQQESQHYQLRNSFVLEAFGWSMDE